MFTQRFSAKTKTKTKRNEPSCPGYDSTSCDGGDCGSSDASGGVAVTAVAKEDSHKLGQLADNFTEQFNNSTDALRTWGGGIMGKKSQAVMDKRRKAIEAEVLKKAQY